MQVIGTCMFVQYNVYFCSSTRPLVDKHNWKSNSNKSCFILASESAFDFRIFRLFTRHPPPHTVKVPMPAHRFKSSDWSILQILLACVADVL